MRRITKQFLKISKQEWEKRFQLVSEDGTPLELPKEGQEEDDLSEEELEEMELVEDIGDFLDELVEKEEAKKNKDK